MAFQHHPRQIESRKEAELFAMVPTNVWAQCLDTVKGAEWSLVLRRSWMSVNDLPTRCYQSSSTVDSSSASNDMNHPYPHRRVVGSAEKATSHRSVCSAMLAYYTSTQRFGFESISRSIGPSLSIIIYAETDMT